MTTASGQLPEACNVAPCRDGVVGVTTWSHDGPLPWMKIVYCGCPKGRWLDKTLNGQEVIVTDKEKP